MAAVTMAAGSSPFAPARSSPLASSPLATSSSTPRPRPTPARNESFARSRPLRPFASVSASLSQTPSAPGKKPVKLIQPPKNFQAGTFILNLTQAELSRRD